MRKSASTSFFRLSLGALHDLLTATYPAGQLLPRHRYITEDIAARAHARTDATIAKSSRRRPARGFDDGLDPFHDPWQHRPGSGTPDPRRSL